MSTHRARSYPALRSKLINFPYSRPIQMIQVVFLVAFIIYLISTEIKVFNINFRFPRIIFSLLLVSSIASNYKVFESFKEQLILLSSFNANKFPQSDFKDLDNLNYKYPNLTVTGLPIASLILGKRKLY